MCLCVCARARARSTHTHASLCYRWGGEQGKGAETEFEIFWRDHPREAEYNCYSILAQYKYNGTI